MPLASFLIVVGGLAGLAGLFLPYVIGAASNVEDEASRSFVWLVIVGFPLLIGPSVPVVRLDKLTRNMAIFATACGGLLLLLLLFVGVPQIGAFKAGWIVTLLMALAMTTGGVIGIRNPPDEAW